MEIRPERAAEVTAIRQLTTAAFAGVEHSLQTEAAILDGLRDAGALTLSLVAVLDGDLVGHIAFSPVLIDEADLGWFGLGPVSVRPDRQGRGVGSALIGCGIAQLRARGANGCVVLGEPTFYRRFGFGSDPSLVYGVAPPEYFLRLPMRGAAPAGRVRYHEAFEATDNG